MGARVPQPLAVWGALCLAGACGRTGFDARGDGSALDPSGDGGSDHDGSTGTGDGALDDSATGDAELDAPIGTLVADFQLLTNLTPPGARRSSGAAVANDERIWIYGGFVGGVGATNTLAAYTPSTGAWVTVVPTGTPPARERHALDWDPGNNVLVVFGGYGGMFPSFTFHNELFVYSPGTNAFTQIPTVGSWPAPRRDVTMVWIPSLAQFLVYGGNDGSGSMNRFDDLWLLSIDVGNTAATWTLLTPGGVTAPAQSAPCIGYDPDARRMILFGGQTADNTATTTTHQYLVDTNVWQLDTTSGTVPSARSFSNCVWDPAVKRLVLYGGQDASGSPIAGVYSYDPDAKVWSTVSPASGSTAPGNCSDAGSVYSSVVGGMYLFGGRTASTTYTDTSRKLDVLVE